MDAPRLPLSHFRLVFAAEGGPGAGDYAGSAWRGAFGRALRLRLFGPDPEASPQENARMLEALKGWRATRDGLRTRN